MSTPARLPEEEVRFRSGVAKPTFRRAATAGGAVSTDWYPPSIERENAARRYLRRLCWEGRPCFCLRCGSRRVYALASGRQRCHDCRYTFSEFAGRWLARSRLSCREWLGLVDLFEAEHPVDEAARLLGRAYATTFHALTVLRAGILAHSAGSQPIVGDNLEALLGVCRHRGHKVLHVAGHVPVFGIVERNGSVAVTMLPDLDPEAVFAMPVKKVRRGNVVYTGQVGIYEALMFGLPADIGGAVRVQFARSPAPIDVASRFWAYAAPRLAAHHGVSSEYFPLYLKELEFRYNHRGGPLAPLLLRYLCDFVPQAAP